VYGNYERPSTPPPRPLVETRSPALPAGWSRVASSSDPGSSFYYNKEKDITQWDPPAPEVRPPTPPRRAPPPPPPRRPPPPPPPRRETWDHYVDNTSGEPFWYNTDTRVTTWDEPTRPRPAPGPDDELDFRGSQGPAGLDAAARHRGLFEGGRPSAGSSSLSRSLTGTSDSQTSIDSSRSTRDVGAVGAATTIGVDATAAALYTSTVSERYKSQHSIESFARHLAQLSETRPSVEKSLDVVAIGRRRRASAAAARGPRRRASATAERARADAAPARAEAARPRARASSSPPAVEKLAKGVPAPGLPLQVKHWTRGVPAPG